MFAVICVSGGQIYLTKNYDQPFPHWMSLVLTSNLKMNQLLQNYRVLFKLKGDSEINQSKTPDYQKST